MRLRTKLFVLLLIPVLALVLDALSASASVQAPQNPQNPRLASVAPHAISAHRAHSISRRSDPCADGSGIPCYHIQTANAPNTNWMGFAADSVGEWLVGRSQFNNARDFYLVQTASSCPGISNCTEDHLLTANNLRVVAANCNQTPNRQTIDLSTNSNQTGDTWYNHDIDNVNGKFRIGSRRCENAGGTYDISFTDSGGDYLSLNNANNNYYTVQYEAANNP